MIVEEKENKSDYEKTKEKAAEALKRIKSRPGPLSKKKKRDLAYAAAADAASKENGTSSSGKSAVASVEQKPTVNGGQQLPKPVPAAHVTPAATQPPVSTSSSSPTSTPAVASKKSRYHNLAHLFETDEEPSPLPPTPGSSPLRRKELPAAEKLPLTTTTTSTANSSSTTSSSMSSSAAIVSTPTSNPTSKSKPQEAEEAKKSQKPSSRQGSRAGTPSREVGGGGNTTSTPTVVSANVNGVGAKKDHELPKLIECVPKGERKEGPSKDIEVVEDLSSVIVVSKNSSKSSVTLVTKEKDRSDSPEVSIVSHSQSVTPGKPALKVSSSKSSRASSPSAVASSSVSSLKTPKKSSSGGGSLKKKEQPALATVPKETFADIGGCEKTLVEMFKMTRHLCYPEMFPELEMLPPRGCILHGPPGCGKTLMAHATAGKKDEVRTA